MKNPFYDDKELLYMNPETGSVATLDEWHPYTPENCNLIEVRWDSESKQWEET